MSRWYFLIPLFAATGLCGCSSKKHDQLALAQPTRSAASLAPGQGQTDFAPERVAQRPPSSEYTDPAKTDHLPLWPTTTAPTAGLPHTPANPAPAFVPPGDVPPPAFTPPQFSEAKLTPADSAPPPFVPAIPAEGTPADPLPPGDDANPLRGPARSAPAPSVIPALPALPQPAAPAMSGQNPLRIGSATIPALPSVVPTAPAPIPNLPLLPHAPPEAPGTGSAESTAIVPLPAFPAPTAPPAEPRVPEAPEPAAPEVAPAPAPRIDFPQVTAPVAPARLPRVSIHSSSKPSLPAASPATLNPSGGAARPFSAADAAAFGPPPASASPAPPPPPPPFPAPAGSAPPPALAAPSLALPPATPEVPPPADPPSFAPPTLDSPPVAVVPIPELPTAPETETPAADPAELPQVPAAPSNEPIEPDVAVSTPRPKATTAIVPPVVGNEPYDVVRVFYGTDRLPILVNEDTFLARIARFIPALVLIILSGIGIGVVWVSRKITWFIGTSALLFFTVLAVWHGVTETVAIATLAGKEEPRYSAEKSVRGRVELGYCEVAIPKTHDPGELEAPEIWRFERDYDPSKHVTLRKTVRLQNDAYYEQLRAQVASSPDRELLVFVHGFNVSFEDAARRTAQMANDLKLQGAPVFYSWPADQYFLLTYSKDEASVGWSAPHLKEFLLDLAHNTDARAINLVAHSMGNRALSTALREIDIQLRDEARLFNQVVLAAPDIDADDFRDNIAPAIQRTAKQVTLYASSNDRALMASRLLHRNARAGDASQGIVLVAGMDTIDVSNIDGGPWGHSYVGASDPVLRDLHLLLTSLPPERRTWLKMSELDGQTYWAFKPLGVASSPAVTEPR